MSGSCRIPRRWRNLTYSAVLSSLYSLANVALVKAVGALMIPYLWQASYDAAMSETKLVFVESRVAEAENALLDRLDDEIHGRCVLGTEERHAIENARKFLWVLRLSRAA